MPRPKGKGRAAYVWLRTRGIASWLAEMYALLGAAGGLAFVWFACWLFNYSEPALRIAGTVLQLLGVCSVVLGMWQTRRQFGMPPYLVSFRDWLARRPFWRGPSTIAVNATLPSLRGSGFGRQLPEPLPPGATLGDRVAALEAFAKVLDERHFSLLVSTANRFEKSAEALEVEARLRAAGDDHAHKQLRSASTGGIGISLMGSAWLFVGVVLGGMAPELTRWFGHA